MLICMVKGSSANAVVHCGKKVVHVEISNAPFTIQIEMLSPACPMTPILNPTLPDLGTSEKAYLLYHLKEPIW